MKTHLLRAKDLSRTACGLDVSHKTAQAGKPLRFIFTRDLDSVDCDVCYRSYEAAHSLRDGMVLNELNEGSQ